MSIAKAFCNNVVSINSARVENTDLTETNIGIILIDNHLRLKNLNKEAERIFNVGKVRVLGKKVGDAFSHCGDHFLNLFINTTKEDIHTSTIKINKLDSFVYVQIETMKIRNDSGELFGTIAIIQDLSAVKAAIKQIQITKMLLSLGELAAGVAHHVRTPLTTISGYLQIMLSRFEDDKCAVSKNVVEMLLGEVSHINDVVKELILFAKPPVNKEEEVNINKIIEEALLLSFAKCGRDDIFVKKNLKKSVPFLTIDPNLVQQAFINLFQNALEAMPEEGVLTVDSWINYDLNMLVVSIKDTGEGLSYDILSRIFEPFYTTKLEHLGLGLSVAHRIITEHNGFINVNSSHDEISGSVVQVYLPVVCENSHNLRLAQQQILNLQ
ncbi:PAS domain-containing protein [Selenomonadales bacterium OttesenSCG-928-I06]|nr:PAS domain-containing protein [Selenomonadales bacterium OttesenSCG-928-I06]